MPEIFEDDDARITDLAKRFQTKALAHNQRADDPEDFVRLAYIAKSAVDRILGPGNPHSASLVALCAGLEPDDQMPPAERSRALPGRYRGAALALRAAGLDRVRVQRQNAALPEGRQSFR